MIISGAGLPKELPKLVEGTKVKIAPIISSARGAVLMIKLWLRQKRLPDMIVVEGPEAGGHLGFSREELEDKNRKDIYQIVKEVVQKVKEFEIEYNTRIPVIAAGGIYTGKDIKKALEYGAAGVQMATRFVATEECDADIKYKETYIKATKEEIEIVQSPVGMPGRAINNKFMKEVEKRKLAGIKGTDKKCLNCIKTCNPKETPYCITRALINAVEGNIDDALLFVGSNAYKIDKITTVKKLIEELVSSARFVERRGKNIQLPLDVPLVVRLWGSKAKMLNKKYALIIVRMDGEKQKIYSLDGSKEWEEDIAIHAYKAVR